MLGPDAWGQAVVHVYMPSVTFHACWLAYPYSTA
jgi:hypothetical protein